MRNVDGAVLSWWKWPVSNEMPAYRAAAACGDEPQPERAGDVAHELARAARLAAHERELAVARVVVVVVDVDGDVAPARQGQAVRVARVERVERGVRRRRAAAHALRRAAGRRRAAEARPRRGVLGASPTTKARSATWWTQPVPSRSIGNTIPSGRWSPRPVPRPTSLSPSPAGRSTPTRASTTTVCGRCDGNSLASDPLCSNHRVAMTAQEASRDYCWRRKTRPGSRAEPCECPSSDRSMRKAKREFGWHQRSSERRSNRE